MKKILFILCLMAAMTVTVSAQTPWKIITMEDVTRHGKNVEWNDETCTATFKGKWDRWIDVPGIRGDLTEHSKMKMTILMSDCMLIIVVRYKDAEGKTKELATNTLYGSMGKSIEAKKVVNIDLTNGGKTDPEILKNCVGLRVSMAKGVDGKEEPWICQFGEIVFP